MGTRALGRQEGDSLKQLWQRSDDGGKTWKTTWEIDCRRVK